MTDLSEREERYVAESCSRCGAPHTLVLTLRTVPRGPGPEKVVLFGGADSASLAVSEEPDRSKSTDVRKPLTVRFRCPADSLPATAELSIGHDSGSSVVAVRVDEVSEPGRANGLAEGHVGEPSPSSSTNADMRMHDVLDQELAEWVKNSATSARDFSKTMLTASTAGVPVVFTVLKYLGSSTAATPWQAWGAIVPAALLLLAAGQFALVLRPQYAEVDPKDFVAWRAERLRRMNRSIRWAFTTFAAATLLSIGLFAGVLSSTWS